MMYAMHNVVDRNSDDRYPSTDDHTYIIPIMLNMLEYAIGLTSG